MATTCTVIHTILTYIKLLKRFKFLFLATHTLFRKWPAEAIGSSFPPSYHREELRPHITCMYMQHVVLKPKN